MPMRFFLSGMLMWLLIAVGAQAVELKNEKIQIKVPEGYKIGWQGRKNNVLLTEMIPDGETVKKWTEMVRAQVYLGRTDVVPEQFRMVMVDSWKKSCPAVHAKLMNNGKENGYDYSYFLLSCPLNEKTQKPETTAIKVIKGNENFYIVQKVWWAVPSDESTGKWAAYMEKVKVCDATLKDHSC